MARRREARARCGSPRLLVLCPVAHACAHMSASDPAGVLSAVLVHPSVPWAPAATESSTMRCAPVLPQLTAAMPATSRARGSWSPCAWIRAMAGCPRPACTGALGRMHSWSLYDGGAGRAHVGPGSWPSTTTPTACNARASSTAGGEEDRPSFPNPKRSLRRPALQHSHHHPQLPRVLHALPGTSSWSRAAGKHRDRSSPHACMQRVTA